MGEAVQLDGTASADPDGDPLTTYTWTQVAGPTVTLANASTATPTITAAPNEVSTLGFLLVVGTAADQSEPDLVVIFVLEDKNNAIWVSIAGDDGNAGTRAAPLRMVQTAIDAASAGGQGRFADDRRLDNRG
jgi:hypothetical protein